MSGTQDDVQDTQAQMPERMPATAGTLLTWATMNGAAPLGPGEGQMVLQSAQEANAAASAVSASVPASSQVDPKWVDIILGKQNAVRIKELAEIISNRGGNTGDAMDEEGKPSSTEERLNALDELEEMVESIDNAGDLRELGLWPLIISCFAHADENSEVRAAALSVVGTAIQNNPAVQTHYMDMATAVATNSQTGADVSEEERNKVAASNHAEGVTLLLAGLSAPSLAVKNKAFYALSSLVRHNPRAFRDFVVASGFDIVVDLIKDSDPKIVRRAFFLFNFLLTTEDDELAPGATYSALQRLQVPQLAQQLIPAFPEDDDIREKCSAVIESLEKYSATHTGIPAKRKAEQTNPQINSTSR